MIAETRRQVILDALKRERSISVHALAELLNTSVSTVRRDLIVLDERGLLSKVHGGAALNDAQLSAVELDMLTKENLMLPEKEAIARAAVGMIRAERSPRSAQRGVAARHDPWSRNNLLQVQRARAYAGADAEGLHCIRSRRQDKAAYRGDRGVYRPCRIESV